MDNKTLAILLFLLYLVITFLMMGFFYNDKGKDMGGFNTVFVYFIWILWIFVMGSATYIATDLQTYGHFALGCLFLMGIGTNTSIYVASK